ncbi:MAG TPA: cellulase family glycosylhydrolase [Polyangiaceae bacterium]
MQRYVRGAVLGLGIFAGLASCGAEDAKRDRDREDAGSAGTATAGSSTAGSAGQSSTGGDTGAGGKGSSGTAGSNATGGSTATGGTGGTNGSGSGGDAATAGESSGGAGTTGNSGGAGTTGNSGGEAGSAGAPPRPPIPAQTAAEAMGKGVNLGQMFENTQHPPTLEAASAKIDAYYEKGFRNVRIPVTWTEPTNGSALVVDPAVGDVDRANPRLAVIAGVVDHALSKDGMYVVLNAHHEHALKTERRAAVLERLWSDLAEIFAERDHRLIFEILNEPHADDDAAMPAANLREMTALAYAKIRAVDPERIVVIGGNRWFGASEVPEVWTNLDGVGGGDDPYVMATFHHYNPWTFCGNDQGSYDDAWTDANLSDPMDTMLDWADSVGNGMPVYIGEWGVAWQSRYDTLACNNVRLWYQKLHAEFAAPRGIPTSVWDDGGWFMIFDHATNEYANNLVDCISGTCAWDGTERYAGCE